MQTSSSVIDARQDIEKVYQETLGWLYSRLAAFHRIGAGAYKPGLETTRRLAMAFGNPQDKFKTVHIAGTNGKGSVSHTVAAVLSCNGYKTGLYTSPHLVDFAERIRVDGKKIGHAAVIDFVNRFAQSAVDADPSFFELATVMAFDHFAKEHVDVAVIETGLGGRLDSTNIINPLVAAVTNVSFDHTSILGDTLQLIAGEKAGIFKPSSLAVVGETDRITRNVFKQEAQKQGCRILFADQYVRLSKTSGDAYMTPFGEILPELTGDCQQANLCTVMAVLQGLQQQGFVLDESKTKYAIENVCRLTGLRGRWETVARKPLIICDTGHNTSAWQYNGSRLKSVISQHRTLHMVIGFVADKDIESMAAYMPEDARYYFVQPSTPRAACSEKVRAVFEARGLSGKTFDTVEDGFVYAQKNAAPEDVIFVGGSNFTVADFIASNRL